MLSLYYYYIISILLCAVSSHLVRHIFASLHLFWRISLTFWRIRCVFSSHLVVKSTHLHFRVKRVFNILSRLRQRTYRGGKAVKQRRWVSGVTEKIKMTGISCDTRSFFNGMYYRAVTYQYSYRFCRLWLNDSASKNTVNVHYKFM